MCLLGSAHTCVHVPMPLGGNPIDAGVGTPEEFNRDSSPSHRKRREAWVVERRDDLLQKCVQNLQLL